MDIYEEAAKLAEHIHDSEQAENYRKLKEEVLKDPNSRKMVEYYKELQAEAQKKILGGSEPPKELMEKISKMGEVLNFNPQITEFFVAEYNLRTLAHDMLKIIADACDLDTAWLEE